MYARGTQPGPNHKRNKRFALRSVAFLYCGCAVCAESRGLGLEERWQVAVAQCSTVSHLAERRTQLVPVGRGGLDVFQRLHQTFVTHAGSVATAASVQLDSHRAAERLADEILVELDLRFEGLAVALRYTQTIGAQCRTHVV